MSPHRPPKLVLRLPVAVRRRHSAPPSRVIALASVSSLATLAGIGAAAACTLVIVVLPGGSLPGDAPAPAIISSPDPQTPTAPPSPPSASGTPTSTASNTPDGGPADMPTAPADGQTLIIVVLPDGSAHTIDPEAPSAGASGEDATNVTGHGMDGMDHHMDPPPSAPPATPQPTVPLP